MNTVAKDVRRIGRAGTAARLDARGIAGRIAAWWGSDGTMQRFTAERERDQRLVRGSRRGLSAESETAIVGGLAASGERRSSANDSSSAGPTPRANASVPMPTVPPSAKPGPGRNDLERGAHDPDAAPHAPGEPQHQRVPRASAHVGSQVERRAERDDEDAGDEQDDPHRQHLVAERVDAVDAQQQVDERADEQRVRDRPDARAARRACGRRRGSAARSRCSPCRTRAACASRRPGSARPMGRARASTRRCSRSRARTRRARSRGTRSRTARLPRIRGGVACAPVWGVNAHGTIRAAIAGVDSASAQTQPEEQRCRIQASPPCTPGPPEPPSGGCSARCGERRTRRSRSTACSGRRPRSRSSSSRAVRGSRPTGSWGR